MEYCLNYNKDTEHSNSIKEVNEWNIKYNSKDTTLLEFLDLYRTKRINLFIEDEEVDFVFLTELCNKYSNLYIKFKGDYYFDKIIENKPNFKFFFDTQISDWDVLIGVLKMGATDVYIVENLAFEIDKVAEIVHSYNAKVRVFPNIAQSKWNETSALKKFFIRPEDIEDYSNYIDVIEFYNVDKKIDIYYNIYCKKQKWFGKLNEIIIDFNSEIDNKYIIPRFAEMRIKCGKNCLKGGHCRRCEVIEELSNSLEQSELIVKIDKNKEGIDG